MKLLTWNAAFGRATAAAIALGNTLTCDDAQLICNVSRTRSGTIFPITGAATRMCDGDDVNITWPSSVRHDVGKAADFELAGGVSSARR